MKELLKADGMKLLQTGFNDLNNVVGKRKNAIYQGTPVLPQRARSGPAQVQDMLSYCDLRAIPTQASLASVIKSQIGSRCSSIPRLGIDRGHSWEIEKILLREVS